MPSRSAKKMICQIWTRPVITKNPKASAKMICTICVATRILRLSKRSASEPAVGASASAGKPAAKLTRPSRIALFVSPLITQLWAIICIHVPLSEMSEPMM